MELFAFLTEGALLGLATGASCALFCIPVLIGLTSRNLQRITPTLNLLFFLGGRFIAYILVGAIFSIIGTQLKVITSFQMLSRLVTGGLLIYWGVKGFIESDKERVGCGLKKYAGSLPFIAGILTGISPCPPFIAGITRVLGLGDLLSGVVYFFGFYLTTSIFILPGFLTGLAKFKGKIRVIISFLSLIFGIIFLFIGLFKIATLA